MSSKEEIQPINVFIQRGPLDRKKRQLIITPDLIQFQDKSGLESLTTFHKEEISEYRYGINWIRGFEFTVGREYVTFIRSSSGEILKISFKTFYGARKEEYHKLSNEILNVLWYFFFGHIANEYYHQFQKGAAVTIGKATLTDEGIMVDDEGIFKSGKKTIPWESLEIKEYHTYLAIFSTVDPSNMNATFSYLKDWNTAVLYSVVAMILKNKKSNA